MIHQALNRLSNIMKVIGGIALVGMMLLTVVDVIGRLFQRPIFGSVEIVGFLATIIVAGALPYTYRIGGHVGVEILMQTASRKTQILVRIATRALTLFLFGLITWQMFLHAGELKQIGEVSMSLKFPTYYIAYILGFGLLLFAVTIIETICHDITQLRKGSSK
ncbi:MAG TPA: TRAP transporter small permease [Desulfotignum sp.]|jgi:TRAP-type C4-dicarboxylate transport system permease small subunit|nr:TRAP transporter small permease [Desulfotignum sp.]